MPANIIKLEEVVPGIEGTTFQFQGRDFHVSGDLPTETVFELLALFDMSVEYATKVQEALAAVKTDDLEMLQGVLQEARAELRRVNELTRDKLLAVFQLSQPDLKELPFGAQTTQYVLGTIFEMVGIASKEPAGDLAVPPPNRAERRATAKKTTKPSTRKAASPRTRPAR